MTDDREQSHPLLHEEAARWLVRLRSGEATADDYRRLDGWLAEDPRHRQEFEQVSRMWTSLVGARSLFETEISQAEARWDRQGAAFAPQVRPSGWWSARLAAAGVMMTLAVVTTLWWFSRPPETLRYETAKGEQRQLTLADGSSVMLNTNSQMTVQFSSRSRTVRLDQGEASFTIAKDEQRSFQVEAANGVIHDIGTQFIVSKSMQQVEVSVLDGIVEVGLRAAQEHPGAPAAVVRQGERVSYGTDGRLSEVGPFDRVTVGAWKDGKLIFKTHPLAGVLAELGRYRLEEIRLLDDTLADAPVTGVFNIRELENSLDILQDALPIRARRVDATLIIVERAPPSERMGARR